MDMVSWTRTCGRVVIKRNETKRQRVGWNDYPNKKKSLHLQWNESERGIKSGPKKNKSKNKNDQLNLSEIEANKRANKREEKITINLIMV